VPTETTRSERKASRARVGGRFTRLQPIAADTPQATTADNLPATRYNGFSGNVDL
jgi:hypothetical protein